MVTATASITIVGQALLRCCAHLTSVKFDLTIHCIKPNVLMSSVVLTCSLMALMLVVGLFACPGPKEEFYMRALKDRHVIQGTVVSKNITNIQAAGQGVVEVIYTIKVTESYKGDLEQGSVVNVTSNSADRTCGRDLEANTGEHFLLGIDESEWGYSTYQNNLFRHLNEVTTAEDLLLAEYKRQKEQALSS